LAQDTIRTFELGPPRGPVFVVYMAGAPCSGKTSLAEHLSESFGIPVVSYDKLARYLDPQSSFTQRREEAVFNLAVAVIGQFCQQGYGCVFDANVTSRRWRSRLRQEIASCGGTSIFIFLKTPQSFRDRIQARNREITSQLKKGFIMETQRIQYELRRLEAPALEENALPFDSEQGALAFDRLVSSIKSRLSS